MDPLRPAHAFDRAQRRRRSLAIPVAVFKKFGDDQGGGLAALVAYYSFFSLFPLLLVFVTVLGFVLQGNPSLEKSVEDSVLGQFPVIGKQIHVHALEGSATALVIGLLGALWGGLGVTQAAQRAFDHVWAVPRKQRPDFLHSRLRGIALLIVLGTLFLVATVASGLVTGGLHGPLLKVAGIALALLLNLALFFFAFRLMTSDEVATKCLLIGVVVAAVAWEVLQIVGGYYIGHVYKKSSNTYAQFALVIALLIWLHLGAQLTLFAAEINVVVARKLWPRSLFGDPTLPEDQKTLRALAKVEERSPVEQVDVRFQPSTGPRPRGEAPDQNSRSGASRRVMPSGHEQSPPSAGQP
ncbi:MAG: YihY/virulence factor BrkB family protein [Solirubrobacteraceae bacterium]